MPDQTGRGDRRLGWTALMGIVFVALALGLPNWMLGRWAFAFGPDQPGASAQELASVERVSNVFRQVARAAKSGVVHIQVEGNSRAREAIEELERERGELLERWEEIKGDAEDRNPEAPLDSEVMKLLEDVRRINRQIEELEEQLPPASGSGIVLDERGHILTNNHVVSQRTAIRVTLPDETERRAELVGADPKTDLAVIRVDGPNLAPLPFGDSDAMEVGDWVLAVGAPFGLAQTVTHGIISAKGRADISVDRDIYYQNFLQTDASINPGNSGGPLLNVRGEVIGVNTAIATNGRAANAGVAFAIPSNMALRVAAQLMEHGVVHRGFLGINLSELTNDDVDLFGLRNRHGVMVDMIFEDSAAHRAGLQVEDVILSVDQVRITNRRHLQSTIANVAPGQVASITVVRDGRERTIDVTLDEQPANMARVATDARAIVERPINALSLNVRTMRESLLGTLRLGRYPELFRPLLNHGDAVGVFVLSLDANRDEEDAPIGPGDRIVSCNGSIVANVGDLMRSIDESKRSGKALELQVIDPDGGERGVRIKAQ